MDFPTPSASDPKLAENTLSTVLAASDIVFDAIIGFSFKPPMRTPFDVALPLIAQAGLLIALVDIPSSWDVKHGEVAELGIPIFFTPGRAC